MINIPTPLFFWRIIHVTASDSTPMDENVLRKKEFLLPLLCLKKLKIIIIKYRRVRERKKAAKSKRKHI